MKHLARSLRNAAKGIALSFSEEINMRLHALSACGVVLIGSLLHLRLWEWAFIFAAIGFVIAAEAFNTALEELCDMLRPTHDPHVAKIKDISAGAALLASLTAIVIGVCILGPHIVAVFLL